jgi:hypothetical protein
MDSEQRISASTDIAALSAGVVAVVVSLFVSPGRYGSIGPVVSITLILVIWAYVWPHTRRLLQSIAFGCSIGLASIPAIGFFDEAARSRAPLTYLSTEEWDCRQDPCKDNGDHESRVPDMDLATGWLLISVLVFGVDRAAQRRKAPD